MVAVTGVLNAVGAVKVAHAPPDGAVGILPDPSGLINSAKIIIIKLGTLSAKYKIS